MYRTGSSPDGSRAQQVLNCKPNFDGYTEIYKVKCDWLILRADVTEISFLLRIADVIFGGDRYM